MNWTNILKDGDGDEDYDYGRSYRRERPRYRYVDTPIKRELLNEVVRHANLIISTTKEEIQELKSNPKRIFTAALLVNKLEDFVKQIEDLIKMMKERAE